MLSPLLAIAQLLALQASPTTTPVPATASSTTTSAVSTDAVVDTTPAVEVSAAGTVADLGSSGSAPVDPSSAGPPPLPDDDGLRALAASDIGAARGTLRRAARTADLAGTRALALRLLASNDPSAATARICARSLRLDPEVEVRRAGAECLGRLGPRLSGAHSAALVSALQDPALDVLTMAGWALSNVGDAGTIGPVAALIGHPDNRVGVLFRGYATRLRDRLGLQYDGDDGSHPDRPDDGSPIAVPPGVALTLPSTGLEQAAATGWLGVYGAMAGWIHGPLLLAAHGGQAGAEAGSLAALGMAALGSAGMSAYAFSRADRLRLSHTVVQLGVFGGLAGYGAGQLSDVGAPSGVASANLSFLGTVVGTGLGMAMVEVGAPTTGALAAGLSAGVGAGIAGGTLAAAYRYPFNQSFGAMLLVGSATGAATTMLLAQEDVGLFPAAGAGIGMLMGGGAGGVIGIIADPEALTESSGWIVVGGMATGAAMGAALGLVAPSEWDPLRAGTLKLQPPGLVVLPANGIRPEAVTMATIGGTF